MLFRERLQEAFVGNALVSYIGTYASTFKCRPMYLAIISCNAPIRGEIRKGAIHYLYKTLCSYTIIAVGLNERMLQIEICSCHVIVWYQMRLVSTCLLKRLFLAWQPLRDFYGTTYSIFSGLVVHIENKLPSDLRVLLARLRMHLLLQDSENCFYRRS